MVKTKTKYECPECEKELKNARALAGHMWFAHNKRIGDKADLREEIKKLESEDRINADTSEKIRQISETLSDVNDKIEQLLKKTQQEQPHNPDEKAEEKTEEKKKTDEEEDDEDDIYGLSAIARWLFGTKKKDKNKEPKKDDDDDDSIFL